MKLQSCFDWFKIGLTPEAQDINENEKAIDLQLLLDLSKVVFALDNITFFKCKVFFIQHVCLFYTLKQLILNYLNASIFPHMFKCIIVLDGKGLVFFCLFIQMHHYGIWILLVFRLYEGKYIVKNGAFKDLN